MKKIKFISGVAVSAIIVSVLIFNSCSKQENECRINAKEQSIKLSDENQAFIIRLIDFKEKIDYIKQNPDYKSGEMMDASEAVKSMEDLFNVSHGFPDEQYGNTKTDTTVVVIDVDNNEEVLMDDVATKYEEIKTIVIQYYYNSGFTEKGFLLLDLEKGEIANNQMEVSVRSVTGEKDDGWEPFGEDDDWLYGYGMGRCDYTQDTTDAAEEIQKALNKHKPLVSPPPGYRFVYDLDEPIPLYHEDILNYPNPENPPPANYMDYLIFYVTESSGNFTLGVEDCLIPDEMNFHFNGEEEIIYEILPVELEKPSNWTFMECDLKGLEGEDGAGEIIYFHENHLQYAFRYLVSVGIIKPPIEL